MWNSVERDTDQDLTISTRQLNVQWSHTFWHWPCNHTSDQAMPKHLKWKKQRITNRHKYRLNRQGFDPPTIGAWTSEIKQARTSTLKHSQWEDHLAVDNHLLHCWEARTVLLKCWKKNKNNLKLRKRINQLNKHIQNLSETTSRSVDGNVWTVTRHT